MRLIFRAIGLFSLIGFVFSNNQTNVPSISIVGGVPAAIDEFPYLTVLRLGGSLCGGSLIGPFHVLTAAHCLYGKSQSSVSTFTVRLKTLALDGSTPGAITTGVKKFIIHEKYNPSTMDNDVALLVLSKAVTGVTGIPLPSSTTSATTQKPATITTPLYTCTCKPTTKPTVNKGKTTKKSAAIKASGYANMNAVIVGWGTTSSGGSISQDLLKANVKIQDNSVCTKEYGVDFIGNDMLCASAPGKDTCQGDSGGPIIVDGVQVGITSWGTGCADPKFAGVYTTYVNWIQTTRTNNPN